MNHLLQPDYEKKTWDDRFSENESSCCVHHAAAGARRSPCIAAGCQAPGRATGRSPKSSPEGAVVGWEQRLGGEGAKEGRKKAISRERGDTKSYRMALQRFWGLSAILVTLVWPCNIRSWRRKEEQECCVPGHENSTRCWCDQGCTETTRISSRAAQQGPAVPGGLGITSWTSSSAARLSLIHQMLFLLLSSPVGLNFPPPGALWSGQDLERPGGGGRVSFKITQGVDSSLAVIFWKGLACPNRSLLCPWPSAVGSRASSGCPCGG